MPDNTPKTPHRLPIGRSLENFRAPRLHPNVRPVCPCSGCATGVRFLLSIRTVAQSQDDCIEN